MAAGSLIAGPADAPLVVLIHGLAGSHHTWDRVLPLIEPRARVCALDLTGTGSSRGRNTGPPALGSQFADEEGDDSVRGVRLWVIRCKWWGGPKRFNDALDQLCGYTTLRESRLALIFYVREQNLTSIIEKAHAQMRERAESSFWETPGPEGEFRCRVRRPDDPEREAVLTVLFFHIG